VRLAASGERTFAHHSVLCGFSLGSDTVRDDSTGGRELPPQHWLPGRRLL